VSDTIYFALLGALLLAWLGGFTMTRKKRSSAARCRLSVDVGDMKEDIEWTAKKLGMTVSELTREAFRAYAKRDANSVSWLDVAMLWGHLYSLSKKFVRFRDDPTSKEAADEFQQALDWLIIEVQNLWDEMRK